MNEYQDITKTGLLYLEAKRKDKILGLHSNGLVTRSKPVLVMYVLAYINKCA